MVRSQYPRSAELYARACKVLPGGNTRSSVFRSPHPLYAQHGEGSRLIDVDGIERIDFLNNYTSLIHGHRHPVIVEAVTKALGHLTAVAMPTESEIELAEILCERVPGFERVRFANSGTEAVMMAIKAARAFTGRPKIAKCEGAYHGSYDFAEVSTGPAPAAWGNDPHSLAYSDGTPPSVMKEVVVIPFNDSAAAKRILTPHAKDLAGVIVDPMPNQAGLVPATNQFLSAIEDFCRESGALMIFDEVVTFRLGYGGAQGDFGFRPDLTALAKVIGGGFPVGAVAGRADVMSVFDPSKGKPKVPHAGTFNANPITMAAGAAAIRHLTRDRLSFINRLGDRARGFLNEAFKTAGWPGQATGRGSLFRIHLTNATLTDYRSAYQAPAEKQKLEILLNFLLDNGFVISPIGVGNVSTVMKDSDVERMAETFLSGLRHLSSAPMAAE